MPKCCGLFSQKKPAKPLELRVAEPFDNELGGNDCLDGNCDDEDFKDPVNWLVDENRKEHRTDMYEQKDLIVRRAGVVKLRVAFTREFNSAGDTLRLEFKTGKAPAIQYGTMATVDCKEDGKLDKTGWSGALEVNNETIDLEIYIPPNAAIGKYSVKLSLRTLLEDNSIHISSSSQPSIYILANPMSELDTCYFDKRTGLFNKSEEFLDEYVFNDVGAIWRGSVNNFGPKKWIYGQFQEPVLDLVCHLLANDHRTAKASGGIWLRDLIKLVRVLSSNANSCNFDGVLQGNWSGDYEGGKMPTAWNGSVNICKEYIKNGYSPVKYGQCWVFSGLLTTLLRAVGIPARSVTNFASAHDGDDTMTIDVFIDENGKDLKWSSDSVWNFHVWNECWLQRPDIPKSMGFDGWQAVDSTPQEESNGVSQCGPAPVKAVREGQAFVNYDTNFLFGEVNADRCTWMTNRYGEVVELTERKTGAVGHYISTKAEGKDNFARKDLTNDYKFKEGSDEEREAFERAVTFGGSYSRDMADHMMKNYSIIQRELLNKSRSTLKLEIITKEFAIGDDIEIKLVVTSEDGKLVEFVQEPELTLYSTYYSYGFKIGGVNNVIAQRALEQKFIREQFNSSVTFPKKDYEGRLARDGQSHLRAVAMIKVKNPSTGDIETHTARQDFSLTVPPMVSIAVSKSPSIKMQMKI
ncbi:unnamed protein product [Oikopleura dioica]|uniref:Transglutaminase-like domain-containing protein n=1 Tax=Oikopleura dioica TaxID=34765 RepID=E4XEQ5_OIKDI|nr:unnamed protein product [Oikopleura dioica]